MTYSNYPLNSWLLSPEELFTESKLNDVSYQSQIKDYYSWWVEYSFNQTSEVENTFIRAQLHDESGELITITPIEEYSLNQTAPQYFYKNYEPFGDFESNGTNIYIKIFEGQWESGDNNQDTGKLIGLSDVLVFDEYAYVPLDYFQAAEELEIELNDFYYLSPSGDINPHYSIIGPKFFSSYSTSPIYGDSIYYFPSLNSDQDHFYFDHQEIYLNSNDYNNLSNVTKTLEVSLDGSSWEVDNRYFGDDLIYKSGYRFSVGDDFSINIFNYDVNKYFRVKYEGFDSDGYYREVTTTPLKILSTPISYVDRNIGQATFSLGMSSEFDQTLTIIQNEKDPDGDGTFYYEWQKSTDENNWDIIEGYSSSDLALISDDAGNYIRAVVSYTDKKGYGESIYTESAYIYFDEPVSDLTTTTSNINDKTTENPSISGPNDIQGSETSSKSIEENTTAVHTFSANKTVNWSLSDGSDKSLFSINASSGELKFLSPQSYSSPTDHNKKNDYVVFVRATDSDGNISDQKVTVSIKADQRVDLSNHQIGESYHLENIKDYDGNLHANTGSVSNSLKSSYKYQGNLDVNNDGVLEAIYTNKISGRWVTGELTNGQINYGDHGAGGATRVVGIYSDPLIAEGENNGGYLSDGVTPAPANFGVSDADRYVVVNGETIDRLALNSQVRFQNDLTSDNLSLKTSGDYDSDGYQEVYWKTNDGDVYLRALMHADGNIQYANYQNQTQMSDYLTSKGYADFISDIV